MPGIAGLGSGLAASLRMSVFALEQGTPTARISQGLPAIVVAPQERETGVPEWAAELPPAATAATTAVARMIRVFIVLLSGDSPISRRSGHGQHGDFPFLSGWVQQMLPPVAAHVPQ